MNPARILAALIGPACPLCGRRMAPAVYQQHTVREHGKGKR